MNNSYYIITGDTNGTIQHLTSAASEGDALRNFKADAHIADSTREMAVYLTPKRISEYGYKIIEKALADGFAHDDANLIQIADQLCKYPEQEWIFKAFPDFSFGDWMQVVDNFQFDRDKEIYGNMEEVYEYLREDCNE